MVNDATPSPEQLRAAMNVLFAWEQRGRPGTQAEFLAQNAGLAELLEPLLADATPPRATDAAPPLAADATPPLAAHTSVGPYTILELLGQGGMGTVYLAEQHEPVQRLVALKVIKLGMDTTAVLRRFDTERQALAMMEHDSIARVLDAGSTADGRPYFAMEYVRGEPLTAFCDRERLGLAERLELFQKACAGVQHAHQKGVIHRDLKPNNILAMAQDGNALVRIIDFGLARATDHRLGDTLQTLDGQIVGTPTYMSPEQAAGSPDDVDTRADVYALGVVLYELLVGAVPIAPDDLLAGGAAAFHRRLLDSEPERPSTRLRQREAESSETAEQRRLDPAALLRRVRGDLDWITMKALEKDRSRRYQSAGELAADIGRYLDDEPVLASPPTLRYRLRKFVRRYRLQVSAAALVLVTLVAGLIGTIGFAVSATARKNELEATAYAAMLRDTEAKIDNGDILAIRDGEPWTLAGQLDAVDEAQRGFAWRWLRERSKPPRVEDGRSFDDTIVAVAPGPRGRWLLLKLAGPAEPGSTILPPVADRIGTGQLRVVPLVGDGAAAFDLPAVCGAILPDGRRLLVANKRTLLIWDLEGQKVEARLELQRQVSALGVSADGTRWVVGDRDGDIAVGMVEGLVRTNQAPGSGPPVTHVSFSPDATRILLASGGHAYICGSANLILAHDLVFSRSGETVLAAAWSPDGNQIALGGIGGRLALWNSRDGRHERELTPHRQLENNGHNVCDVVFTPDGRRLISGGAMFRVHNPRTGKHLASLHAGAPVRALALVPGTARLVLGLWLPPARGAVATVDLARKPWPIELMGHVPVRGNAVLGLAVAPGGRHAFTVSPASVRKWDLPAGRELFAFREQSLDLRALALRPNRNEVAAAGMHGRGVILDAESGDVLRRFAVPPTALGEANGQPPSTGVLLLRYRPDGGLLAAGIGSWVVRQRDPERPTPILLLDPEDGSVVRELNGHHAGLGALAWSPDGQRLASTGFDHKLFLWEVETGRRTELRWPGGSECAVRFDRSGQRLLVPSVEGLWILDGRTGDRLGSYAMEPAYVQSLEFDVEERRLLVGTSAGATIWDFPPRHRLLTLDWPFRTWGARFTGDDSGVIAVGAHGGVGLQEIAPRPEMFAVRAAARAAAELVRDRLARGKLVVDVRAAVEKAGLEPAVRAAALAVLQNTTDDPAVIATHRKR